MSEVATQACGASDTPFSPGFPSCFIGGLIELNLIDRTVRAVANVLPTVSTGFSENPSVHATHILVPPRTEAPLYLRGGSVLPLSPSWGGEGAASCDTASARLHLSVI